MKSLQKAQNNRVRLQLQDKDKEEAKKETPKPSTSVATLKAEAVLNRSLQFLI